MRLHLVGEEHLLDPLQADQRALPILAVAIAVRRHVDGLLRVRRHLMRTRATFAYCDMSETMILSPTSSPRTISMTLTELRPSTTGTRTAVLPSFSSLNSEAEPEPALNAGRPLYS